MVKAIICGVSEYDYHTNPLGINEDIKNVENTFNSIFKANSNILGNNGYIKKNEFVREMLSINTYFLQNHNDEPIIFYFAGHGSRNVSGNHEIIFSDGTSMETIQIIELLQGNNTRKLILILDCCYSGSVSVEQIQIKVQDSLEKIVKRGTDVLCACKMDQQSYGYTNLGGNFTNLMLESLAIGDNRDRGLSINEWVNYIRLIEKNKHIEKENQKFVFHSNKIGDYHIIEPKKDKYKPKRIEYSTDFLDCLEIESMHTGQYKRYSLKILLKKPLNSNSFIQELSTLKQDSEKFEKYRTQAAENRYKNNFVTHIFCYIYLTEEDYVNNNWIFQATWVSEQANRSTFYNKSDRLENEWAIKDNANYYLLYKFYRENLVSDKVIIQEGKQIATDVINLMIPTIQRFIEYQNDEISENQFISFVVYYQEKMSNLFLLAGDIGFSQDKLINEWIEKLIALCGSADNCLISYNEYFLKNRDSKNRERNFENGLIAYNKDLEHFNRIDKNINKGLSISEKI